MLAVVEDQERDNAAQETRFMRALRATVPACFNDGGRSFYESRIRELECLSQGETHD